MGFWKRFDWLMEHRKLLRRASLVWSILIVSTTAGVFFERLYNDPEAITGPVATIMTGLIGLVAVVEGIYNYTRGKEDENNDK